MAVIIAVSGSLRHFTTPTRRGLTTKSEASQAPAYSPITTLVSVR